MDAYVWEKSCQFLRDQLERNYGKAALPISVNISHYDINSPTLCQTLRSLVEKYRLPPDLLKLEITESAYVENPEQLISVVQELRKMGFTVEMDDFGADYSSRNTLKDVPVDVLKLDTRSHYLRQRQGTPSASPVFVLFRLRTFHAVFLLVHT